MIVKKINSCKKYLVSRGIKVTRRRSSIRRSSKRRSSKRRSSRRRSSKKDVSFPYADFGLPKKDNRAIIEMIQNIYIEEIRKNPSKIPSVMIDINAELWDLSSTYRKMSQSKSEELQDRIETYYINTLRKTSMK